jgi:hypothetical protein
MKQELLQKRQCNDFKILASPCKGGFPHRRATERLFQENRLGVNQWMPPHSPGFVGGAEVHFEYKFYTQNFHGLFWEIGKNRVHTTTSLEKNETLFGIYR